MEPDAPCRRTFSRMTANTIQLEVPVRPDGYSDLIELAMPLARTRAVLLGRAARRSCAAAVRRLRARAVNARTAARRPACTQGQVDARQPRLLAGAIAPKQARPRPARSGT